MARVWCPFWVLLVLKVVFSSPCQECNPRGMAGYGAFENSDQNQCLELVCPEIHVETMTNPVAMTTQAFSVPKTCCSVPYCSIPAPRPPPPPPPPAIGPPIYTQTTCCTSTAPNPCKCGCGCKCGCEEGCKCGCGGAYGCKCGCGGACGCKCGCKCCQPQPAPMPQCCMPYQMPMPVAPSYCVQSVVVGGSKTDAQHKEEGSEGPGGGRPEGRVGRPGEGGTSPEGDQRVGADQLHGRADGIFPPRGRGRRDQTGARGGPRDGGAGSRLGRDGLGGRLGSLAAFGGGGILTGASRQPSDGDNDDTRRYETYLEKIMDVIKDKCEPECCDPSPMVVMAQPQPRVRVRRIRRRKQRKYVVESCEDPDEIVEEEEEPAAAPYVIAAPCACRRSCCCARRRRHFL